MKTKQKLPHLVLRNSSKKASLALIILLFLNCFLFQKTYASIITANVIAPQDTAAKAAAPKKPNWYEKISLRGYVQVRYNRLLETNPKLKCDQCDKSWGEGGGVFIRRARLVFSGNISDNVYVYVQPDLASSASSTSLHFAQLRDAYFDVSIDKKKEFRFRIGQSKVPFGFENLQSSQNRLALDRNDALNSAVANERDLGVFFYWAPDKIRKRFSELVSSGLKGSGDYGVLGLGVYNGQTANRPEISTTKTIPATNGTPEKFSANINQHVVARLTYPFEFKNGQIIETGISAYTGIYTVTSDQRNLNAKGPNDFADERVAASLTIYPQPIGFQAEYNIGVGPEFNPENLTIEKRSLRGGYAQAMYMLKLQKQIIIPFVKSQYYNGGKKHELDARRYIVLDHEFGIEWQPFPSFELVGIYTISDRTFEDAKTRSNHQTGNLFRLQAQVNF